ncbi:hypothetical protein IFM89_039450 [Coptis chinensis]|uniref:NAC domain-containing protein n=1 Tax=Coptis chinensis TaxID=261450 RepID=A0A835I9W9_9MAGN|nr:hypothetical protein IFM89_039450 [Coptis chinensis]
MITLLPLLTVTTNYHSNQWCSTLITVPLLCIDDFCARFSFKTSVTMCSSESAVSSPVYIGVNSSDQEVVISLERIIDGAALPADVITDVNAYNSTPWELLDGIWYFSTLEEPKATECGYWKVTGECHRISTNSSTIGSRLTLEFYTGQPPYGIKTNWVMHDYRINQKGLCEISNAKVFPSLCRVFLSCSRSSNHEEEQNNVANGMSVEKNVENKEILQHCTSRSQVKRASECGPLADSKRHLEDPRSDYPIQDPHESCDFSENDFILLQDLDNPLSAFAMLRALDSRPCHDMEPEYPDAKFSVSAPMRPDQVVVRPESLGSFICFLRSGENLVQDYSPPVVALEQNNEASMNVPCVQSDVKPSSSSGDSLVQDTSLPAEATKQNSEASKSVRFLPTDESLRPTPKPEEVSPSTSGGHAVVLPTEESKATKSRVKKLGQVKRRGKKYWCFVPF